VLKIIEWIYYLAGFILLDAGIALFSGGRFIFLQSLLDNAIFFGFFAILMLIWYFIILKLMKKRSD